MKLFVGFYLLVAAACLGVAAHGCYLEHESIRDAGDDASYPVRTPNGDPCEGGVVVAYYGCTRPGDAYWRKYCEGPVIGCIAPGSPRSSTWGQR